MEAHLTKLAKRAITSKAWRWMPGMRYVSDAWNRDGFDRVPEHLDLVAFQSWVAAPPDFRDPATRGCLLALVKEAREAPFGYVTCQRYRHADRDYAPDMWETDWVYWDTPEGPAFKSGSYEAALIAALEAAPTR